MESILFYFPEPQTQVEFYEGQMPEPSVLKITDTKKCKNLIVVAFDYWCHTLEKWLNSNLMYLLTWQLKPPFFWLWIHQSFLQ